MPVQATTYVFEDTTAGVLNSAVAPCTIAGALQRTFTVTDSFTVTNVSLGVTASHGDSGDVLVALLSPAGTFLVIRGAAGNNFPANIDVMFSDAAAPRPFNNGVVDNTLSPFYERPVAPDAGVSFAAAFAGQNSQGVWTMFMCNQPGSAGNYLQSRLVLEDAGNLTPVCSSTATYDWALNGSGNPFVTSTTSDLTMNLVNAADPDGVGAGNNFLTLIGLRGAEPDFYSIEMNPANTFQRGLQVDYTFNPPVYDLALTVLDIDQSGWDDLVRLDARDSNGNLLAYDPTILGTVVQMGDLFDGSAPNVTDPNIDGNVVFVFEGPVSTLTGWYMIGDDAGPAFQWSGFGDFSFCGFDYGDAPNSYDTVLGTGARHALADRDLFLGVALPEGEVDGQPGAAANGDGVEEDALASFPGADLDPGDTYSLDVTVTNNSGSPGTVCGWVDFDLNAQAGDGTFDADEGVCVGTGACAGAGPLTCTLDFTVPADFVFVQDEPTYARFRVTSGAITVNDANGRFDDGEVEDFQIPANVLPVTVNWFRSEWQDGDLAVTWQTASETDTVGFEIWARSDTESIRVTSTPVQVVAFGSTRPRDYAVVLRASDLPEGASELHVVALSSRGRADWIGPYAIGSQAGERIFEVAQRESAPVPAGSAAPTRDDAVDVLVAGKGVHRIDHDMLMAQGLDLRGTSVADITLSHQGRPVGRRIVANGGVWDANSYLDFFAAALDLDTALVSDQDVYRLTTSAGAGVSHQVITGLPNTFATDYVETVWWGDPVHYGFSQPNGDPWYDRAVLASGQPASTRLDVSTEDWLGKGPVYLRLDLAGITNFPGTQADHEIEVFFDDQPVGLFTEDGLIPWNLSLPVSITASGAHHADLVVTGQTGNPFDLVHVDRWGIEYRRQSIARNDRLLFSANGGGQEIRGFSEPDLLAYARSGDQLRYMSMPPVADPDGGFMARFGLESTVTEGDGFDNGFEEPPENFKAIGPVFDVWVSTPSRLLVPQLRPSAVEASIPAGTVDHVVIAPHAFLAALDGYRLDREAEGIALHVVSTESIAARNGHGLLTPAAIQGFLDDLRTTGYQTVLLVGTSTLDPMNRLGDGVPDLIPAPFVRSHDLIYFTPSDGLLVDFDGDQLPDRAVGRWPVRDTAQLADLIAKTADHAAQPGGLSAVVVAGDDPRFEQQADNLLADLTGPGVQLDPIFVSDYPAGQAGIDAARLDLLASIDSGRQLTVFSGHGSPSSWTFQNLLSPTSANQLTNQGMPTLAIPLTCYSTYFVESAQSTLGHSLTIDGQHGAAAVIGPATLSRLGPNQRMADAVIQALRNGEDLGTALMDAKRSFAGRQGMRDAILNWNLLGDPLLRLPPP